MSSVLRHSAKVQPQIKSPELKRVAIMNFVGYLLVTLLFLVALFLILLVLVQRGRGGGLAGAFGGLGGQSAFGTKAGDLFTRITIVVAGVWILLCVFSVKYFNIADDPLQEGLGGETQQTAPSGTQPGGATGSAPASGTAPASGGVPVGGTSPAAGSTPSPTVPAGTPVERPEGQ
jgi:preprotein translocase subunit SecG